VGACWLIGKGKIENQLSKIRLLKTGLLDEVLSLGLLTRGTLRHRVRFNFGADIHSVRYNQLRGVCRPTSYKLSLNQLSTETDQIQNECLSP